MSYMGIIGQVLLLAFLGGLSLWGLKYFVSLLVFSRKKETINKLNARVSILKLHLKGKIKNKSNKIETVLKKNSVLLSFVRPKIEIICGLEFSRASDYQTLMSNLHQISEEIIGHIKLKNKNNPHVLEYSDDLSDETVLSETEKITEKCRKLVKYDKAHMIIIIELVDATDELIEKIEDFNLLVAYEKNQKKIEDIPQKIEIENYDELSAIVDKAKKNSSYEAELPHLEPDSLKKSA